MSVKIRFGLKPSKGLRHDRQKWTVRQGVGPNADSVTVSADPQYGHPTPEPVSSGMATGCPFRSQ